MVDARQKAGRRGRQPNRVADQLTQLRQRNKEQQADARERERRVDEALREFVTAGSRVDAAEQAHTAKVRRLRARIDALDEQHAAAVADDMAARAQAALTIHDCGRTVGEVADLLGLSQRAVTRMLRDARSDTAATLVRRAGPPVPAETVATAPTSPDASGPRRSGGAALANPLGARDSAGDPTQVREFVQPGGHGLPG